MNRPIRSFDGRERVALIAGLRTPFAKRGTAYRHLSARELGVLAVRELLEKTRLRPDDLDAVVFGQVVPDVKAPNIAREVVLSLGLPPSVDAFSVSRACATSTQAFASAAQMIQTGQADVVVAGGADSMSDVPITVGRRLGDALVDASQAKKPMDKIRAFAGLSPKDLLPEPPAIAERITGLSMGQSAEKMAQENAIPREAQDDFAYRSHTRAGQAYQSGILEEEVFKVFARPDYAPLARDNTVRFETERSDYDALKPVFDRKWGTVTAANSSALTDGAAAVLLMRESTARALGHRPLALLRSFAFAALDPSEQLLMGPAYAAPRALDAAGLTVADLTLVDFHEAFSAQILSNLQAFGSRTFAEDKLGRSRALGEIDLENFNIYGGSIALGHPFAATGARQLTTVARELDRRGGGLALVAQCAAGGLGAAVVLER